MKISLESAIQVIHAATSGTLATRSLREPGYPFATILPFVPDDTHNPIFLISTIAEHTKNLLADPRCSFLVNTPQDGDVQSGARLTLVGDILRIEADEELIGRFLRYQPGMQQYLDFGDFAFFRLSPINLRYIGGFGQAGWISPEQWKSAARLSLGEEAAIFRELDVQAPAKIRLLGFDCYGIDYENEDQRFRRNHPETPLPPNELKAIVKELVMSQR